ncbi:MAG: universal stress protein, partial [Deltaproteobacteria bacterium]|nr:universal stress protein [Deltaproteobacteria bacterium]
MNILVGYDGSKVAGDALKVAREQAKAFNAKVYIITSMVGGPEV